MTSSKEQSEANEKEDYVTTAELLEVLEERDAALAELESAECQSLHVCLAYFAALPRPDRAIELCTE